MNDFQIFCKLGEGAYSTVYKVKRLIDGNIYALKKVKLLNLSEKEKSNALNEVRILASIKSTYVISYKEAFFDEKDSTLGIVMEYADNGDLYQKIVSHKKTANFFEESEIWKIFIQLVKGLKALHDLKILHRDLKSANVFLFKNDIAKLGDLNVSKVLKKGLSYTQTGTPYYASPEVWKDQPYDNKSDIWSLGCVLYEMITLRPPFRAENMEGLYNKVIKGYVNKIPDRFSNDIFIIVKLLLQVNPENRPTCEEILKHPIVVKRIEYFSSFDDAKYSQEEFYDGKELLRTIKIPKNLLFLSDKLPKPNYISNINNLKVNKLKSYRSFTKNQLEDKLPPTKFMKKNSIKNEENEKTINEDNEENVNNDNSNNDNYGKRSESNDDKQTNNEKKKIENNHKKLNINNSNKYHQIFRDETPKLKRINMGNLDKMGIIELSNNLPQLNIVNPKKKQIQRIKYMNKNNSHGHLEELYKIYAPYMHQPAMKYNKYKIEKNKYKNNDYIKNLEKYYDDIHNYNYNYNLRRENSSGSQRLVLENKIIPKRKLSPLRRNIINIY